MTREELKDVLKSKGNKLAKAAVDLIESGGPLEELRKLVQQGCNHVYVERDPNHPRTRFINHHVLDACFDTHFGVVEQHESERVITTVLGEVHRSEGRQEYFKFLLDAGFSPGTNGYRGELFDGILFECFRSNDLSNVERRERAKTFARILIDSGRFDIQKFACKSYYWVGSLNKLDTILSFGANPAGSGMVDRALHYVACAPNSGESHASRADVIRRLIELGGTPQTTMQCSYDARFQIESYGLLDMLAGFNIMSIEQPPEYRAYLERTGRKNPRLQLIAGV